MAQTGYTPLLIYSSSTTSNTPAAGSLTNSSLGSELAINITDGKLFYKDNGGNVQVIAWKVTPTTAGGTGLTSYTAGDTVYYGSGSTLSKLGIGSSGYYMSSSGSAPQWSAPAALTKTDDTNVTLTLGGSASTALLNAASIAAGWTGQLAVSRGGTGLASGTSGGIPYFSDTTTIASSAALAANALVIGGGAGAAPATTTTGTGVITAIGKNTNSASGLAVLNASGYLAIAQGGTNSNATATAGAVAYGTGTSYAFTAAGSANQVLVSNGASAPSWANVSSLGVASFSAGTTGFTPNSATTGAVTLAGTLATTNGGTGLTSFTANQVFYASSTSAIGQSTNLQFDGTTLTANAETVTGAVTHSATTANLAYGTSQTSGTWTAGGAAQTGTLTLDQSTKAHTLNIGTGATENATTKTINIGTAGVSGSTTTMTIGSTNGTSVTANGSWSYASNPTFSGGTANGVLYLNGSKVATSGSALVFDGSNLGIGVTPSAWGAGFKVLQYGYCSVWTGSATGVIHRIYSNAYFDGTNDYYLASNYAAKYIVNSSGQYQWFNAASGTAGNTISWVQAMTLDASGQLGIGATSPGTILDIFKSQGNDNTLNTIRVSNTTSPGDQFSVRLAMAKTVGGVPYGQVMGPKDANGYLAFTSGTSDTERARIDTNGNVQVGTAALATNATNGFFYIPTCAGAPTGTPTAKTGLVPMIYDSTNNNFYIYNGAWKKVALA